MKKLIIVPARHNKAAPCFFGESIRRYSTGSYIYIALKGGQAAAVGSGILVKEEAVALVLVFAVMVIMAFSLRSQIAKKNMISSFFEKLKRKLLPIHGSTSVFIHELYKRLIHDKGIIVLAVLFIFAIQTSNEAISFKYDSIPEATYYAYLEQLEGRITPERNRS